MFMLWLLVAAVAGGVLSGEAGTDRLLTPFAATVRDLVPVLEDVASPAAAGQGPNLRCVEGQPQCAAYWLVL